MLENYEIDDKYIKELIKKNGYKIKKYEGIKLKDLSDKELMFCTIVFKHVYTLLSILYFPSKTELNRYIEEYLKPLNKEVFRRLGESKKNHPNRYYSGKLVSKGDEESIFYMRKDIEDNTKGLALPGENEIRNKKYNIKEQAKSKNAYPVMNKDHNSDNKTGYDTIALFEQLYYQSSHNFWKPIIDSFEDSALSVLGNNGDINNIMHDVRMDFLTVKENESRENYGKTQSKYKDYDNKLKEEKEYLEQGKEVPEELRNYLEYHHNYKTRTIGYDSLDYDEINKYISNREDKREIIKLLEQWTDKQPKQAILARKTVDYIVKSLNTYMDEAELKTIFRVTNIAESLGTEHKEIRRIFKKIKEDTPSLKDLLV